MEPSDRKRRGGRDDNVRPPSKQRPDATEDEVEEFFAILHRMRDASRPRAKPTARWSLEFVSEDFAAHDAAKGGMDDAREDGPPAEAEAEAAGTPAAENLAPRPLDLNADPEPESKAVASPPDRGDVTTAPCAPA